MATFVIARIARGGAGRLIYPNGTEVGVGGLRCFPSPLPLHLAQHHHHRHGKQHVGIIHVSYPLNNQQWRHYYHHTLHQIPSSPRPTFMCTLYPRLQRKSRWWAIIFTATRISGNGKNRGVVSFQCQIRIQIQGRVGDRAGIGASGLGSAPLTCACLLAA